MTVSYRHMYKYLTQIYVSYFLYIVLFVGYIVHYPEPLFENMGSLEI